MMKRIGKIISLGLLLFLVVTLWRFAVNFYTDYTAPPFDPKAHLLSYARLGAGAKKVLLLHGLAGSKRYWLPRLDSFSKTHQLLVPDLLGFGESPKPNTRYDMNDHLRAIEELLKRTEFAERPEQVMVVGHSLGAVLALALMATLPEKFQAGVLISIPVLETSGEMFIEPKEQPGIFHHMANGGMWMRLCCYLRDSYEVSFLGPLLLGLPSEVFADLTKHTWTSISHTLKHTVIETKLADLAKQAGDQPILLIHGTDDRTASLENARRLAGLTKNGSFKEVAGDHQLFLQDPRALWQLIEDFEGNL